MMIYMTTTPTTCKHCGRTIINEPGDGWVDPEATGDDSVWRETCDAHDTFMADHEPDLDRAVKAADTLSHAALVAAAQNTVEMHDADETV